jgi:hypothetical protein
MGNQRFSIIFNNKLMIKMHEKLNCVFAYFDNERERMLLFSFVASKWCESHTVERSPLRLALTENVKCNSCTNTNVLSCSLQRRVRLESHRMMHAHTQPSLCGCSVREENASKKVFIENIHEREEKYLKKCF